MGNRRAKALYRTCTVAQACQTWLGVLLNGAVVLWCALWLVFVARDQAPAWPWLVAMLVPGLFLADLFSGLVHWGTDTWFDETQFCRVVSIAREHHIYPHHIVDYGVRDYLGYSCWPAALAIGPVVAVLSIAVPPSPVTYLCMFLCGEIALFMVFGTYGHRLGHAPARSPVVRWLQRLRLLISPSYHKVHHSGNHDVRYCVINGWADAVCDRIGFWRGLETCHRLHEISSPSQRCRMVPAIRERPSLHDRSRSFPDGASSRGAPGTGELAAHRST